MNQASTQINTPVAEGQGNAFPVQQVGNATKDEMAHSPAQTVKKNETQAKSEFQKFVEQSVGYALPMYGYDLFRDLPTTFAPVDNVPVTPDYIIGPGDELIVHVWGQVEANQKVVVDRNGLINLPKIGSIGVAGVSYQKLSEHIGDAISRKFSNFEIDVSMGKLRSIQIFVVGQAARPGNYTVSSLSTLVNALFASGGPSANGSMRHIQLRRGDKVVTEFDMYDLLLKGDKSKDVQLLPGDVIYIPSIGAMAAITGSVNTPAIFELKGRESLSDLLDLAGGLTNVASGQKVSVERIFEHDTRKVDEFQMNKDGLGKTVRDGDLVKIGSISPRFDNAVTLRGNVASPGRYPWKDGMRVSDLIPDKDFLIPGAYWDKQNQMHRKRGNEDSLQNEMIENSRAEINWDYAVIERLKKNDLTTTLIPFNLGRALAAKDTADNQLLKEGDIVTVFSKEDIKVPVAKQNVLVRLEGEVNTAGIYKALPGETLRQLVTRVGGLTPNAYLFGAELDRESVRIMQQKRLQEMADKMDADIKRNLSNKQQNALAPDQAAGALAQAEAQAGLVKKMKSIQATGRIVLEIPATNSGLKDLPDIPLENGDRFFVPSMPTTASVMGMVYNQNAFIFKQGVRVSDLLARAGGPTRDADESNIYLLRADGSVLSAQSSSSIFNRFSGNELMPGDTVIVPELLDKTTFSKSLVDASQIFFQFAMGFAGLKVLGL